MLDPMVLATSLMLLSAPLVLAAMGGLLSERSGVINIGLEGMMLMSCVLTAIVSQRSGSPVFGVIAGVAGAVALSYFHLLLTQTYRLDHIVSGMAINALAYGASNVIDRRLLSTAESSRFPHFPEVFFVVLAFLSPILVSFVLARTRPGLRLRAVGEDPTKARQMGISSSLVRANALLWTGVLCGLAGSLVVSSAGSFVDLMTAGRGFIALAALILGGWRPLPALAACLVFGFFDALQIQLQGTPIAGAKLPPEFWKALPYLATLIGLCGIVGKNKAPAGLGRP